MSPRRTRAPPLVQRGRCDARHRRGEIGTLAGALLIGGANALFADRSTALVAALGGAFIGGVFGAVWAVFARMGGSDAYRQSFVAPELTDVCIVSLHTDDPQEAADGRDRLAGTSWLTIVDVDSNGTPLLSTK